MKIVSIIFTAVLVLCLPACGTMIPGTMYSLRDGTAMPFQIEQSYGSGDLSASNPATGETFTGHYTGIYTNGGAALAEDTGSYSDTTQNVANGSMYQTNGTYGGVGAAFVPPTNATARGILIGNQGTVITIYLDIQTGLFPSGNGVGIDNKGNRYQIQFGGS